jgi:hypothetical protein
VRVLFSAFCLWLVIATSASAQDGQAQLARLKQALHLSAQQTDAWNAYQTAMAPDPQAQARDAAAQRMLPQLTTPRRVALIQAVMQDRLSEFRRRSAGVVTFYEQLTPDQQHTFDEQTSPAASRGGGD